jgi:pilus assembly protein Flp/PilA
MFLMAQIALSDLGDRARQHDNERGATAVEYGLLVALIAGVIIAIVTLLGAKIGAIFTDITGKL